MMHPLKWTMRSLNRSVRPLKRLLRWFDGRGVYMFPAILHQYPPRPLRLGPAGRRKRSSRPLPTIARVTPSYNQAPYIGQTVESILGQAYPRLRYAVLDGGSSDGSAEIIARHASRLDYWHSQRDKGQGDAISSGFRKVEGEIMGWLNADDLLTPGSLWIIADYFERHPDVDVLYGNRILIDGDGNEIGRWILPPHDSEALVMADVVPQETCFWRSSLWERVGGIDPSFQFALDWDLLLRFRSAGARFRHIPAFLGCFRVHEQQKTSAMIDTVGRDESARLHLRELGREPSRDEVDAVINGIRRRSAWRIVLHLLGLRF